MAKGRRPLSKKGRLSSGGLGCAYVFLLLFGTFGLAFLFPVLFFPAKAAYEARSWEAVPCTVLSSGLAAHDSDDGTTYSIEVTYRYDYDGVSYQGDRYDLYIMSSSGRDGKQAVVDSMPPGSEINCWVDPAKPSRSVVHRTMSWVSLFALIPGVFLLIGYGGAFLLWRATRRMKKVESRLPGAPPPFGEGAGAGGFSFQEPERDAALQRIETLFPHRSDAAADARPGQVSYDYDPAYSAGFSGPVTLKPTLGPVGKLVSAVLVALFWNGIVSIFLWQLYKSWTEGSFEGCLAAFLVPFVLIGIGLLISVPYQLLASFNPRPHLTLSPGTLRLGETASLTWSFEGDTSRMRRLTVTLEGEEKATYRQGTSTSTATNVFARHTLQETTYASEIAAGNAQVTIPADAMHTFNAPNNKIVWRICLAGEIAWWPDVGEQMELTILPPAESGRYGGEY